MNSDFSAARARLDAAEAKREEVLLRHIANGVMIESRTVEIDESVVIAPGAKILSGTILRGKTVIGAGCHATELSGSTVYFDRIAFPLKNLPVAALTPEEERLPPAQLAQTVRARLAVFADGPAVLALQGRRDLHFAALSALADGLAGGLRGRDGPVLVAVAADVGKALGQALAVRLPGVPLLCLDGVQLPPGSYLDVAAPIANGQVLPVVIKTLVF